MKIKRILSLLVIIPCLAFTASCAKKVNLGENVTRLRADCFYGETENVTLYIYPELRESPMIADGTQNPVKKIVVIKLKALNGKTGEFKVRFTTDREYDETFNFSTISDCYISTVEVNKLPDKPFIATISFGDKDENVNMQSLLLDGTVTPDTALNNAYSAKKDYLDAMINGDAFNGEIYLRLIAENGKNYWYVGFITEKNTLCVLLDAKGKVIDERIVPRSID